MRRRSLRLYRSKVGPAVRGITGSGDGAHEKFLNSWEIATSMFANTFRFERHIHLPSEEERIGKTGVRAGVVVRSVRRREESEEANYASIS